MGADDAATFAGSLVDELADAEPSAGDSVEGGRSCLTSCDERAGRRPRKEDIANGSGSEESSPNQTRHSRAHWGHTSATTALSTEARRMTVRAAAIERDSGRVEWCSMCRRKSVLLVHSLFVLHSVATSEGRLSLEEHNTNTARFSLFSLSHVCGRPGARTALASTAAACRCAARDILTAAGLIRPPFVRVLTCLSVCQRHVVLLQHVLHVVFHHHPATHHGQTTVPRLPLPLTQHRTLHSTSTLLLVLLHHPTNLSQPFSPHAGRPYRG